jgi:hypothetical protein
MIYSNNLYLCEYSVCRLSSGVGTDAHYQQTRGQGQRSIEGLDFFHFKEKNQFIFVTPFFQGFPPNFFHEFINRHKFSCSDNYSSCFLVNLFELFFIILIAIVK